MLVGGTGLFFYSVFNFSYRDTSTGLPRLPSLSHELINVAYYYKEDALQLIATGAILIVVGILVIRNRKEVL